MPTSAPLGHLLPREGGRIPLHRLLIQMAFDTRMPLPRIRHFERKREIFFVRGKAKDVRIAASGKHPAPCAPEERCFMQTDSRMKQKMANEKDPSAPLGMTIREYRSPHDFHLAAMPTSAPSGHLLPWEGGRMPLHRLPMKKTYDTRMPLPLSSFRARSSKASASDSTVSRIVISSESEKSFSFAVKKGCKRSGQWETLCSLRPEKTLFHAGRFMQENEEKKHLKQAIRQRKSPAFRRSFFIGSIVPEPR